MHGWKFEYRTRFLPVAETMPSSGLKTFDSMPGRRMIVPRSCTEIRNKGLRSVEDVSCAVSAGLRSFVAGADA